MNVLGIEKQDQNEVFRLLMGILYLGNIFFRSGGKDDAHIQDAQGTESPLFFFIDLFSCGHVCSPYSIGFQFLF